VSLNNKICHWLPYTWSKPTFITLINPLTTFRHLYLYPSRDNIQTRKDLLRNTVGTCINMKKAILVYSGFNKPCILDHHAPKLVLWTTVFSRVDLLICFQLTSSSDSAVQTVSSADGETLLFNLHPTIEKQVWNVKIRNRSKLINVCFTETLCIKAYCIHPAWNMCFYFSLYRTLKACCVSSILGLQWWLFKGLLSWCIL
jgi:hypothetical protein